MDILIRSAYICDSSSPHHQQVKDVLVSKGVIVKVANKIALPPKAKVIQHTGLHLSQGWVDVNVQLRDPGFEQFETIKTGMEAAAAGGFTHICAMPNTLPVQQTKSQIESILKKAAGGVVNVLPIGAATKGLDSDELAEMMDMRHAGAIAFSNGSMPIGNAGVTERALWYVKAMDAWLMAHPEDLSISSHGCMNEGALSTKLGLPAISPLAEELAVSNLLYLLEYTQSRLLLLNISLKKSVDLIRAAKKRKLHLAATVNACNLLSDELDVSNYNTYYKVNPPLRSTDDIKALISAINDGTIDLLSSAHQPVDDDSKKCEFDKAAFGMVGLESCFAVANTALHKSVPTDKLVDLLSNNARKLLSLPCATIETGTKADLTLFCPNEEFVFTEKMLRSKSRNTPYIGKLLRGTVKGILNNNQLFN